MFKKQEIASVTYYWLFNKVRLELHGKWDNYYDFTKSHSSYWFDLPLINIKIKRNYKGHSIS